MPFCTYAEWSVGICCYSVDKRRDGARSPPPPPPPTTPANGTDLSNHRLFFQVLEYKSTSKMSVTMPVTAVGRRRPWLVGGGAAAPSAPLWTGGGVLPTDPPAT